ncbi:hypothetical protein GGD41_003428 [Paraburkholderia bryophila]|uniref:Amidinotransferase n=1 Tax=Paraburkholderia bryophila TaxID=420952 RepID=A0A7Y9W977_9BURK|nr:hypothetical protein [Paraburkholderia bryophila]
MAASARDEVSAAAAALEEAGVRVHVFDDDGAAQTPDSVFPNNWFSTHPGGHVAIYPMVSANRRRERRLDVIDMLKADYRMQDVIDYSGLERDDVFLEGTGAMVLDHMARIAYTARSRRADPVALERFCTHFNFEPVCFDTRDTSGQPIYHTNVMMSVATEFALIGFDLIPDEVRRAEIQRRLGESGRKVIALDSAQIGHFADNALELSGPAWTGARTVGARAGQPDGTTARIDRAIGPLATPQRADDRNGRRLGALHAGGHSSRAAP